MDEGLRSRIQENLVAHRAGQFQFLADLVKTPSMTPPRGIKGEMAGEMAALTELTEKALKRLGLGVERHAPPEELLLEHGLSEITNLVVRHEFGSGPVVALSAYGDTGARGDGWTADPFGAEIQGGVLYGLGVTSKADFAVYAYALAALRDAGPALSGTVELHFTFDGEADGQLGPGWLLETGVVNPDYAMGSGFAYGIGTSAMGDLQLQVEIESRAVPGDISGGSEPDALETAIGVLDALYRMREEIGEIRSEIPGIGSPTLVVGQIEGGERPGPGSPSNWTGG
jgi:acetylornithine deacetylase/succinyl-diaminopimelate desuccinylase-like protein